MYFEKRKTFIKAYISQFGYFPLVWMFHSRGLNNKINSLYERALRITYGDRSSSVTRAWFRHRNIQPLVTEMFKVKNNIAPEIMKEIFAPKMSPYDLRNIHLFKRRRVNSLWHDTESVFYLGPKIWDLVPDEIKKVYLGQGEFIIT